MTEQHSAADGGRKSRIRRRRFLSGIGGGGLAAAAVIFGKPAAASTNVVKGCCNLCVTPNTSLSNCEALVHYVWGCTEEGSLHCVCCEVGTTGQSCSGVSQSAYDCFYN